ncbi:ATP-dependent DNA helicase Rep [Desulfuromonas sp. DDH964]|uniref:ATP-dependent helicase n=1 Tax=Desulfuromonas sp. DDH964 TaxID=1823759 RepID=UPI00078E17CC|nr:UvrD-helicase domain-containing protein [Desulfuromonas sp. DDH964]AMV73520.1 ATP-dependent DNA helicase Rep [Desulfuromonas sp. DDH964]
MHINDLNPPQQAAVRHTEGPLLLLAGAGSGKTRVITCRIAYLLEQGVAAEEILAVTFTNKAAREMRERVKAMVGRKSGQGMVISTFHSLALRILRADIERLGFKQNFSIYGSADQERLVRDLTRDLLAEGVRCDLDRVLWLISDAKNRLITPTEFTAGGSDPERLLAAQVYPRYQRALKAFNAVDFDDILLLAVRLLRDDPAVRRAWQARFRYIMVDEYQDTNAAQYHLLRLLCEEHRNLCVVGDDDQSVYGWRGADLGNILDFEKDYPGARVIKLEQNYRSTGNILAAANAVIRNNTRRKEKVLWTAGDPGEPVLSLCCEDEEDEARSVVEQIHAERFRRNLQYRDFAILYRTNVQSRAFEEQLRFENIPYVLIGGQQFFDRKEVKDALAYFRVLVNPRDEVSLLRILNFPRRGIGETTADVLIQASAAQSRPLWEVMRQVSELDELGEKAHSAVAGFVELMERFRRQFRKPLRLVETARELFAEIGLENEIYRTANDPQQGKRRAENLAEVLNALAGYVEREGEASLAGFLDKVSLLDQDEPVRNDKEHKLSRDAVVLMSLHSSKGLEFPQVFLVGLEEGFLPHRKSMEAGADLDEERRLCYVGITRARQRLVLLHARRRKKYGKLEPRTPSPFLAELPEGSMERGTSEGRPQLPPGEQEQMASDFFSRMRNMLGE